MGIGYSLPEPGEADGDEQRPDDETRDEEDFDVGDEIPVGEKEVGKGDKEEENELAEAFSPDRQTDGRDDDAQPAVLLNQQPQQIEDIAAIKLKMVKNRAKHIQDVRSILTKDQRVWFDMHKPGMMKHRHKGHKGRMQ